MTGKLIELPRKLQWDELPTWVGIVKGTQLLAKVERCVDGEQYQWGAWNGGALLGQGLVDSKEAGMESARRALEAGVLVLRPLPAKDGS